MPTGRQIAFSALNRIGAAMADQPVGMFLPVARLVNEGLPAGADRPTNAAITAVLHHMWIGKKAVPQGLRVCHLNFHDDTGKEWSMLGVYKTGPMSGPPSDPIALAVDTA